MKCSHCGAEFFSDDNICTYCGSQNTIITPIKPSSQEPATTSSQNKSDLRRQNEPERIRNRIINAYSKRLSVFAVLFVIAVLISAITKWHFIPLIFVGFFALCFIVQLVVFLCFIRKNKPNNP